MIATIRSPVIATSAGRPGAPVPSTTSASVISRSVGTAVSGESSRTQKNVRTTSTTIGSAASGSSITGITFHLSKAVQGWETPSRSSSPIMIGAGRCGSQRTKPCWSLSAVTVRPSRRLRRRPRVARSSQLHLGQPQVVRADPACRRRPAPAPVRAGCSPAPSRAAR